MNWKLRMAFIIIAIIIFTAGYAYYFSTTQRLESELVIYTYESLLKWGDDPEAVYNAVFKGFEEKYGVTVKVVEFPDARDTLLAVIEEINLYGEPKADIIIGLDNILVEEAKGRGILDRYIPPNIDVIPKDLRDALDPDGYSIPYDYGLIAFVFDRERIVLEDISLEDFEDPALASLLVAEDPSRSSTGISFLLMEIAFYEKILGTDWRDWWISVRDYINVQPSWGDAYNIFFTEEANRPIVVSYGTDPAYSFYFYNSTRYDAVVLSFEGKDYAWLQIEGISIVKDAPHRKAAEKFVEWFISEDVQQYMALNNWMYPANKNIELPSSYEYAIHPDEVIALNQYLSKQEIRDNLKDWLKEWINIMSG
jgi:thiamine transport system substrate-binding protein